MLVKYKIIMHQNDVTNNLGDTYTISDEYCTLEKAIENLEIFISENQISTFTSDDGITYYISYSITFGDCDYIHTISNMELKGIIRKIKIADVLN
jgi:hypothetical protein